MPPIQDYNIYTGNAYKGQISDASTPRVIGSGVAEGAIGFGVAVQAGTNPDQVKVGSAAGGVFGVAVREANHEAGRTRDTAISSTGVEYLDGSSVSVFREGYINVEVTGEAAVAGTPPYVILATGEFDGTATGGGTVTTNMTFMEAGAVGDIVRVRIDIVA